MLLGKNVLLLCSMLTVSFFMCAGEESGRKAGIHNVYIVKTGPNQDVAALCDWIAAMLVGGNQGYFSTENKRVYHPDQKVLGTAEEQSREREIRQQQALFAQIYAAQRKQVQQIRLERQQPSLSQTEKSCYSCFTRAWHRLSGR